MSKKVLTDYHKQFIAENYRALGPQGCADALGVKYGTVYAYAQSHGIKCKSFAAEQISFMQEHRYDMTAALVAEKIGLTERQVRGWYNNHMPKKIRVFNDRYFQNIDSQEKAYWLGFIFADGYITSHSCGVSDVSSSTRITYEFGMELQRKDEYHLERLRDALGGVHQIYQKESNQLICNNRMPSHTYSSVLRVYSKNIVMDLRANGIEFNKSYSSVFPIVNDELFLDFLRGYLDGDGCIYTGLHDQGEKHPAHIRWVCNKREILDYIAEKANVLYGIKMRVYRKDAAFALVCYAKQDIARLLSLLYHTDCNLWLERKYDKYLTLCKNGLAA